MVSATIKILTGIIGLIVLLVVVLNLFGETTPTMQTATATITQEQQCNAAGCNYNTTEATEEGDTANPCRNATGGVANTTVCPTGQHNAPLNGLFTSTGVILIIFLAAAFILIIGMILYKMKGE